jgi:hypothetical protein
MMRTARRDRIALQKLPLARKQFAIDLWPDDWVRFVFAGRRRASSLPKFPSQISNDRARRSAPNQAQMRNFG